MKRVIATIGLAVGLSLVGTGIADAGTAPNTRCAEAQTALMKLENKAAIENNQARKELLMRMITGARLAVGSQCS